MLIAHAEDDWDIPHSHSDVLFQAFLEPLLPPVDAPLEPWKMTEELWKQFAVQQKERRDVRERVMTSTTIARFGRVDRLVGAKRDVVLVKTLAGGHDYLGIQEGLVDVIGHTFVHDVTIPT